MLLYCGYVLAALWQSQDGESKQSTGGRMKGCSGQVEVQGPLRAKRPTTRRVALAFSDIQTLSICIGTHVQKNIRLTGASIARPGACWSTSTLITHGRVSVGPAPRARPQPRSQGYDMALFTLRFRIFLDFISPQPHWSFPQRRSPEVSSELCSLQFSVAYLSLQVVCCTLHAFIKSLLCILNQQTRKNKRCSLPIDK